MDFVTATRRFERWMAAELRRTGRGLNQRDLEDKHRLMAREKDKSAFAFLRATYYRWAQLWPEKCPALAAALRVLAVGDLHLENFGTWRDAEGRLCWGINDFDEAYPLSFANDLVRLMASALLAADAEDFKAAPRAIAGAILEGYAERLADGAKPFVLEERHLVLRKMAYYKEKDPDRFWAKIADDSSPVRVPDPVRKLLLQSFPERGLAVEFLHRREAGLGSLGRPRYLARATWRGGLIAHEAKALIPSAAAWAEGAAGGRPRFMKILAEVLKAGRCPDPFLKPRGDWVLRRLAPRSSKIEIDHLPEDADPLDLLRAMGKETANVHLGTKGAASRIRRDLARQKPRWLEEAAGTMAAAISADWSEWKASRMRGR